MNGIGIGDIIGGVVQQNEAAQAVTRSLEQLRQMQIAEADAAISTQLAQTPDNPDVIDAALRIKMTRSLYGEATALADRYQAVTGNTHELRAGLEYIRERQMPEVPAVADAVFAFLRKHVDADKLRCTGAGKINGEAGIILVFDIDDRTADGLTTLMREAVANQVGCDRVPYGCAGRDHLPPWAREDIRDQVLDVLRKMAAMAPDDDDEPPTPRVLH